VREDMPSRHTQNGSTPLWLLVWLVGMAAIAYWCVVRHLPVIQEHLQSNAQAAVTEVGAPDVSVDVKGRTATLTGAVTTVAQRDSLLGALNDTNGIRSVNNQLNVVQVAIASSEQNAPIVQAVAPTSEQQSDSDGTVNTINDSAPADSDASENTATQAQPDTPETNETVDSNTDNSVAGDETPAQTEPGNPGEDNDALNQQPVHEQVTSEQPNTELLAEDVEAKARALIERAKNKELTGNQPTTAAGKPATFKMQVSDDKLTLTGDMSQQDSLTQFVRSAMSTFDASYVVNSVQVSSDVAPAPWLDSLTQFVTDMKPLSNAGIDLIDSQISLSGIAPDERSHDSVINNALSKLPELSLVERISIADPTEADVTSSENVAGSEPANVESQTLAATNTDEPTTTSATGQSSAPTTELRAELRAKVNELESTTILFESGSDVLTTASLQTIESLAALFAEYTGVDIEIDGHTDSSGLAANNLELSQQRANAVRDYLIKLGISANRLSAYGFGDGVPIADNSTSAGRKMNRRIEFNF